MSKCIRCGQDIPKDKSEYKDERYEIIRHRENGETETINQFCPKCCSALGWWIYLGPMNSLEGGRK